MSSKNNLLLTALVFLLVPNGYAQGWGREYFEWMDLITESCQTTVSGKMKRIFQSERDYYRDVWISMDMYASISGDLRSEIYSHCRSVADSQLRFASCTARFQKNQDWWSRCIRIVDAKSRGLK